jgi:hypothetical protein
MEWQEQYPLSDPRYHTSNIRRMLDDLTRHARADVRKVDDPRAQALFQTTAEVLQELARSYEHFERVTEEAWQS